MTGLSLRCHRALIWLAGTGLPQDWSNVCRAAGGWRPSHRHVVKPLIDRGLVKSCGGVTVDATPAGLRYVVAALSRMRAGPAPEGARWQLGDTVAKRRGSSWRGRVVGFYATANTPIGYAVESYYEPGSVQVWPEAALQDWTPPGGIVPAR